MINQCCSDWQANSKQRYPSHPDSTAKVVQKDSQNRDILNLKLLEQSFFLLTWACHLGSLIPYQLGGKKHQKTIFLFKGAEHLHWLIFLFPMPSVLVEERTLIFPLSSQDKAHVWIRKQTDGDKKTNSFAVALYKEWARQLVSSLTSDW